MSTLMFLQFLSEVSMLTRESRNEAKVSATVFDVTQRWQGL